MSLITDENGRTFDTGELHEPNWTLTQAVDFLCDNFHNCDSEALQIANRISGPLGQPNQCPDGVQVLEDAEFILRKALEHATA